MTKQESLIICRDMWKWLAENPYASKHNYIALHPELPHLEAECSCCQYCVENLIDSGCDSCPLLSFWNNNPDKMSQSAIPCLASVYSTYLRAKNSEDMYECARVAQLISDAAQLELDKLT